MGELARMACWFRCDQWHAVCCRCRDAAHCPSADIFLWRSYDLPWEDKSFEYPASLAPPLQILIDASNGASGAQT